MNKLKKLLLLGTISLLIFALTACGKITVDLNKYITVQTGGYDTMGEAVYVFDYAAFEKDFDGKIKANTKDNPELSALMLTPNMTEPKLLLETCVKPSLDKYDGLKNGDKITIKWQCSDENADKFFNATLEYSDIEHEVSGLKEVAQFDPFEFLKVTYSGVEPLGSLTLTPDKSREEIQNIFFSADKNDDLKNGDTVTVTARYATSAEDFIEKFGAVLKTDKKTYTVEKLPYYVKDVSDISEDLMNKMAAQGEDAFRSYVAKKWNKPENLISVSLAGNYFLSMKEGMNTSHINQLYLVYQIQAKNPDPEKNIIFYYYVRFDDIIKLADGTCSADLSKYTVPNTDWSISEYFLVGNYKYIGYEQLESLFNNCVVTNIESFTYTTTFK